MILGGDELHEISACNVDGKLNQTKYEWKLNNKLKMSHCVTDELEYDVLLFGDIIFVFYFKAKVAMMVEKNMMIIINIPAVINGLSHAITSPINDDIHLLNFKNQTHCKTIYKILKTSL